MIAVLALLGSSCESDKDATALASASAARVRATLAPTHPLGPFYGPEHRRDSRAITDKDLASRSVERRRGAARALARIADDHAERLLGKLLSDADPEVVTWAAYGLGQNCTRRAPQTVRMLTARAASLLVTEGDAAREALTAIADALARCGGADAEQTLIAWLEGVDYLRESAAMALGRLAGQRSSLSDAAIVALLEAAASEPPLEHALYPFTRFTVSTEPARARLLQLSRSALEHDGLPRSFAVRALGQLGVEAVKPLKLSLLDRTLPLSDRANAARALGRLGEPGQKALAEALVAWWSKDDGQGNGKGTTENKGAGKGAGTGTTENKGEGNGKPKFDSKLLSERWGVLSATLGALESAEPSARPVLTALRELALPDKKQPALRRRIIQLRCAAAALLAGHASLSRHLVECDPDPKGRVGALAVVRVLDRGPLRGPRFARYSKFVHSKDPTVRQAALRLITGHPEIKNDHQLLAEALGETQVGTVATAAQILTAYPSRASKDDAESASPSRGALHPEPEVLKALMRVFERKELRNSIEVLSAAIDAAAALQMLSAKATLEHYCQHSNPTLREHAERALRQLGDRARRCSQFTPDPKAPPELGKSIPLEARLVLHTDVGDLTLTLESEQAPVGVARVLDLARSGFYDGMAVHRVVPGFIVQWGDPVGDGYGAGDQRPLRSETSPGPFPALSVGMALAGRDTAATQLFVALGRYPHLDGDYARMGRASAGFERLSVGDVIHKVDVFTGAANPAPKAPKAAKAPPSSSR